MFIFYWKFSRRSPNLPTIPAETGYRSIMNEWIDRSAIHVIVSREMQRMTLENTFKRSIAAKKSWQPVYTWPLVASRKKLMTEMSLYWKWWAIICFLQLLSLFVASTVTTTVVFALVALDPPSRLDESIMNSTINACVLLCKRAVKHRDDELYNRRNKNQRPIL